MTFQSILKHNYRDECSTPTGGIKMVLRAQRAIAKEEEVCISYISIMQGKNL